jgi:hypothetical protein
MNFEIGFGGKDPLELRILDFLNRELWKLLLLLPRMWRFALKNSSNDDSAGRYQLIDEESTGGIVIPPGETSSWRIHRRNTYSTGNR